MNALARPLLLLLAMLAAAPAWADASSDERARQLYLNGATLYDEGEYALAVEAFEEAWRLSRRPGLLYNVAQAWQRLGDLDRAIDALNRYRVYATADEADQLRRQVEELRAQVEAQQAGRRAEPEVPRPDPPLTDADDREDRALVLDREAVRARPHHRPPGGPALIVAGAGVGGGFGVLAGVTYQQAGQAAAAGDRENYERVRPINHGSLAATGVGAGMAIIGVVVTAAELQGARVAALPVVAPAAGGFALGVSGRW